MTAPLVYNDLSVIVTSQDLATAATLIAGADPKEVGGWIKDIQDSLAKIFAAIKGLKLGWAGKTSDEAQAFFDQWDTAMNMLFGSKEHPAEGTLVQVATALLSSANNYNSSEDFIIKLFGTFNQGITPAPGAVSDPTAYVPPPATWITEWWQGAVSEVF